MSEEQGLIGAIARHAKHAKLVRSDWRIHVNQPSNHEAR